MVLGGGWTCGKQPPVFFETFFLVVVVFFCGEGKEKNGNPVFLGGGT